MAYFAMHRLTRALSDNTLKPVSSRTTGASGSDVDNKFGPVRFRRPAVRKLPPEMIQVRAPLIVQSVRDSLYVA